MGMYTEFVANIHFKSDLPPVVVDILTIMTDRDNTVNYIEQWPEHLLFKCNTRWRFMLRCSSYYHVPLSNTVFFVNNKDYYLMINCNFKNYEDEINLFLDWIKPYSNRITGWYRYESATEPTLIWHNEHHD